MTVLTFPRTMLAVILAIALSLSFNAGQARAYHKGEKLKMDYDSFTIHGNFTRRTCSAQANIRSQKGHMVSFSLYWSVGKSLHLLLSYPDLAKLAKRQKLTFRFDDGTKLNFPMQRKKKVLQLPISFGPRGQSFYKAVMTNRNVTIVIEGIGDSVDVKLRDAPRVESGLDLCRKWLH